MTREFKAVIKLDTKEAANLIELHNVRAVTIKLWGDDTEFSYSPRDLNSIKIIETTNRG